VDECKPLNVGSTRMISENEYEISLRADTNNPKYRSGLTPHSSLLTPHTVRQPVVNSTSYAFSALLR